MFFNKEKHGEKLFKCPRCRVNMDKIKQHNVIIDVCRKCNGMWLDDNEINKLVEMSKQGEKKNGKKK